MCNVKKKLIVDMLYKKIINQLFVLLRIEFIDYQVKTKSTDFARVWCNWATTYLVKTSTKQNIEIWIPYSCIITVSNVQVLEKKKKTVIIL